MTPHEFDSTLAKLGKEPALTQDLVLSRLRQHDASMIQAIKALVHLFGLSLGESKKTASHHAAWRAIHLASAPLHEAAKAVQTEGIIEKPHRTSNRAR